MAALEDALRDVQSSRDQLTTDKERYLQEAVKLTKQMQVMTFDADNMQRVSRSLGHYDSDSHDDSDCDSNDDRNGDSDIDCNSDGVSDNQGTVMMTMR